jgi:membrane protease YdiL (CAAX protease family)
MKKNILTLVLLVISGSVTAIAGASLKILKYSVLSYILLFISLILFFLVFYRLYKIFKQSKT